MCSCKTVWALYVVVNYLVYPLNCRLMRKPAAKSLSHEPKKAPVDSKKAPVDLSESKKAPVDPPEGKKAPVDPPESKRPPVDPTHRGKPLAKDPISGLQEKLRKRWPRSVRGKESSEHPEYRPLKFWRSAPRVVSVQYVDNGFFYDVHVHMVNT